MDDRQDGVATAASLAATWTLLAVVLSLNARRSFSRMARRFEGTADNSARNRLGTTLRQALS